MGLSTKQVSSDAQDWNQGSLQSSKADSDSGGSMELPIKRQQEEEEEKKDHNSQQAPDKLNCPRCNSANTKFCYYNNYNKAQPRHFCKACKRHWTKGGMLRNVPVGGGKKKKRLKTSSTTPTSTTKISTTANMNPLAPSFGAKNISDPPEQRLNHAILGPQSVLKDTTFFNTNMDFCIGKNSSVEGDFNGFFGGTSALYIPQSQNHELKFTSPSFNSLDYSFPSSISASTQIPHLYGINSGVSNPVEEAEMSSNWSWDEMDKFVISDVTVPWDDVEIS